MNNFDLTCLLKGVFKTTDGLGNFGMTTERPLDSKIVASCHLQWQLQLERYAWAILRDGALAADAVQEAFVAFTRFGGDVEPDSRKAWLYRVVYREALRLKTSENRHQKLATLLVHEASPTYQTNPLNELASAEEYEYLQQKIKSLSSEQQKVIQMRIIEEKTFGEIAAELDIPISTALSRMRLALERLKKPSHPEGHHDAK